MDELRKKAQPIVNGDPNVETDSQIFSAYVLSDKFRDEVIAYLVEVKTDDSKKAISDIEKFQDGVYSLIQTGPLRVQLVDYSFEGISGSPFSSSDSCEAYDDGETRKRIARMIGLAEIPERDPDALRRLEGKIKRESLSEGFDAIEEVRSVRENWADYQ